MFAKHYRRDYGHYTNYRRDNVRQWKKTVFKHGTWRRLGHPFEAKVFCDNAVLIVFTQC